MFGLLNVVVLIAFLLVAVPFAVACMRVLRASGRFTG